MSFAVLLSSAFVLFIGMLFFGEFGRRVAFHRAERDSEGAWRGIGVVDGAVFGLLGLLLAFTFPALCHASMCGAAWLWKRATRSARRS